MSNVLTTRIWFDVLSVRPHGRARVNLAIELGALSDGRPIEGERPPKTTVLALDVSGSMQGEPLDHVVKSVDVILDAMRPVDSLGVVSFAETAQVVVPPAPLDSAHKRLVASRVGRLFAEGATHVEAGLDAAFGLVAPGENGGVVLLSDGVPNRGACTVQAIAEVAKKRRPHVAVSSLGYGASHAEEILVAVAEAGGGGYAFVPDPSACARAFARAIGAQADVVATGIAIVISPESNVTLRGFVSSREISHFGKEGVVVTVPDMVPGATRVVVAELDVDVTDGFLAPIARVEVRWHAASSHSRPADTHTQALTLEIADRAPAADPEGLPRVMLARVDRTRDEARVLADRGNFAGAAALLRKLLVTIDAVPSFVRGDTTALADAYELAVDEAIAYEQRPSPEAYATFRKQAYASRAAAVPAPPSSRGPMSTRFLEHAQASAPEAWLVVDGDRHPLKAETVIGRAGQCDLVLKSILPSRRHAEVFAEGGAWHVADLGSTSGTYVNDERVDSKGRRLVQGDVVRVGDVKIVFEVSHRGT